MQNKSLVKNVKVLNCYNPNHSIFHINQFKLFACTKLCHKKKEFPKIENMEFQGVNDHISLGKNNDVLTGFIYRKIILGLLIGCTFQECTSNNASGMITYL